MNEKLNRDNEESFVTMPILTQEEIDFMNFVTNKPTTKELIIDATKKILRYSIMCCTFTFVVLISFVVIDILFNIVLKIIK